MHIIHNIFQIVLSNILGFLIYILYNRITRNRYVEKVVARMCADCLYKEESELNEKIDKQIGNAIKVFVEMYSEIKQPFIEYIIEKKITDEKNIWREDSFVRFESIWYKNREIILNHLRIQYKANNFGGLTALDIESRVERFWDILWEGYDDYNLTPPPKEIVKGFLLDKKIEIFELLKSLYSKEVYQI